LAGGRFDNEGNIRRAFESLLEKCARPFEWLVVAEYQISRSGKSPLHVDAAVLDAFNLPRVLGSQGRKGRPEGGGEQEVRRQG
jgi:hypothetical protein